MPIYDDPRELEAWSPGSIWRHDAAPQPMATAPPQVAPPVPSDPSLRPTAEGAAAVAQHFADPVPQVVYLGLNDASREKEKAAFRGQRRAQVLTGAGTDAAMQGKTMAADGETVLDLGQEADLRRYMTELGIGGVRTDKDGQPTETAAQAALRMASLENTFLGTKQKDGERAGGLSAGARDEMAQFLGVLQKVEQGDMAMDRVVMSGHSSGNWIYSEAEGNPGVTFEQMAAITKQFPEARAGVKELMLSACHTLEDKDGFATGDGAQYQDIFPNLTSTWGYDGYSPNHKQGSVAHIKAWLQATQGQNSPRKVANAARQARQNATAKLY